MSNSPPLSENNNDEKSRTRAVGCLGGIGVLSIIPLFAAIGMGIGEGSWEVFWNVFGGGLLIIGVMIILPLPAILPTSRAGRGGSGLIVLDMMFRGIGVLVHATLFIAALWWAFSYSEADHEIPLGTGIRVETVHTKTGVVRKSETLGEYIGGGLGVLGFFGIVFFSVVPAALSGACCIHIHTATKEYKKATLQESKKRRRKVKVSKRK